MKRERFDCGSAELDHLAQDEWVPRNGARVVAQMAPGFPYQCDEPLTGRNQVIRAINRLLVREPGRVGVQPRSTRGGRGC